jgi:LysR family transcriptional regulator, hydrogen peroxide-inducible genes activator
VFCPDAAFRGTIVPTLRQLEYLLAIAEQRNFRRAAERSNTTQPTLSEQLKALEERLGAQLVERAKGGAMLTPIGLQVTEIARRILKDLSEIKNLTRSADSTLKGVLRVGLPSTIGPYLLPAVIPVLHRTYPELKIYVREELPERLPGYLEDGAYDLIITPLPLKREDLYSADLFREPLFLTVASDHPLALGKTVRRADLDRQEVLTLGPGHQLHDVVSSLCEEFGARIRLDYEGTSLDMLREMVITGLGITFMPGLYVRRELSNDPNLKLLEIEGRSIYRIIGLAWRKSSARHDLFEALVALIRDVVKCEFADLTTLARSSDSPTSPRI